MKRRTTNTYLREQLLTRCFEALSEVIDGGLWNRRYVNGNARIHIRSFRFGPSPEIREAIERGWRAAEATTR